jgi:RTX calcium-binding nonapeptide repeat (4 copies)
MRRLLVGMAAGGLIVAMLPGVSVAKVTTPDLRTCIAEAKDVMGSAFDIANYTHIFLGTNGDDYFWGGWHPAGVALYCLFDGNDFVDGYPSDGAVIVGGAGDDQVHVLPTGGTFIGGPGNDATYSSNADSVFYGGPGNDYSYSSAGTFYGGPGDDSVGTLESGGLFIGGAGNDSVGDMVSCQPGCAFFGGPGADRVENLGDGTFYGGPGDDSVGNLRTGGTFYGGPGYDTVDVRIGGTFIPGRQ